LILLQEQSVDAFNLLDGHFVAYLAAYTLPVLHLGGEACIGSHVVLDLDQEAGQVFAGHLVQIGIAFGLKDLLLEKAVFRG